MTPAIILDVLIAALLIAAALRGCWRGLFLSLSGILVLIVAMIGANLGAKALTQPVSDWVTPKIEERIAGTVEKTLEKKGQESGQTLEELLPDSLKGLLDRTGLLDPLRGTLERRAEDSVAATAKAIAAAVARELVETFASDAEIVNLHNWSRGSFSGMTWENVAVMTSVVAVTFFLVFLMAKPLSAYQLGEVYARNLGVDIRLLRIAMVLLSSILSACIVAFAGPISFVGIAAPHLVKSLLGTAKPIWMIPACFLGGSVFCLFCDLLARTMFAPTELSISTVTAIFGAPVVLWIMVRRNKEKMA